MKYNFEYQIQYQEVDANRRLRLYTLENYLLNTAGRAADMGGFGIPHLLPMGWTWIITRLNLEMDYIPTHGDVIRVETWIEQNAHMLSIRDYRVYLINPTDKTEQQIGKAQSTWAVLDLEKREICNALDTPFFDGSVDGEKLEIARSSRLIPIIEPTMVSVHPIQYSDIDYNRHCNSCKYLEWMINARQPQGIEHGFRLDINYAKEISMDDSLHTIVKEENGYVQYQQKNDAGQTCCSARITKANNLIS